ncbi:DUF4416 family protein [Halobacteriovorax sp. GB3]|uniref:DUF4416 family protein n=1 Tax=Halobacteriovorax sp. GB3 TaxID=2719615 RepID=UPI0023622C24|nr:DUF4416 family protein [Halobacteriovorax sp. GB3]MDD0852386.1 DUF4416 family protein [Halobacteriovorax sp. GB3]
MSDLKQASKGLFLGSFLFHNQYITKQELISFWESEFGESIYFQTDHCPMKEYYSKEMGDVEKLERFFLVSRVPMERESLVSLKVWADQLEKSYFQDDKRVFNLDIGLLTLENFSLATGKSYAHRIYLGQGVYSDLNHTFSNKSFEPLPWTYPDYKTSEFIDYLNYLRGILFLSLKK